MSSWKEKRLKLGRLIKEVSDAYGGDDTEWLRAYAKEVVEANQTDLDKAIACFESLLPRRAVWIENPRGSGGGRMESFMANRLS